MQLPQQRRRRRGGVIVSYERRRLCGARTTAADNGVARRRRSTARAPQDVRPPAARKPRTIPDPCSTMPCSIRISQDPCDSLHRIYTVRTPRDPGRNS